MQSPYSISYTIFPTHFTFALVLVLLVSSGSFGLQNGGITGSHVDSANMISDALWTNSEQDRYTSHHSNNEALNFPAVSSVTAINRPVADYDPPSSRFGTFYDTASKLAH